MGLLTLLRKIKRKEKELRILILGLDNAGKTTVVKKFNGEPTDKISPTLGFNIFTLGRRMGEILLLYRFEHTKKN